MVWAINFLKAECMGHLYFVNESKQRKPKNSHQLTKLGGRIGMTEP